MEKNAYKQYIKEVDNWLHSGKRLLLQIWLELSPGKQSRPLQILEVGAGSGRNIETLSRFGQVDAIEVENLGIELPSENPLVDTLYTSKVPFPLEKKYDIICAKGFIEHVENDKQVFERMTDRLITNGVIFLTAPAYQFLFSSHDIALNHFRRYTVTQLNNGQLNVTKKGFFNFLLFPIAAISRILERLLSSRNSENQKQSGNLNPVLNSLIFIILRTEVSLIQRFRLFPFGLTTFALFQKNEYGFSGSRVLQRPATGMQTSNG